MSTKRAPGPAPIFGGVLVVASLIFVWYAFQKRFYPKESKGTGGDKSVESTSPGPDKAPGTSEFASEYAQRPKEVKLRSKLKIDSTSTSVPPSSSRVDWIGESCWPSTWIGLTLIWTLQEDPSSSVNRLQEASPPAGETVSYLLDN